LRSAYRAFNARDVDAAVELMHPEVDWPNAWEGGRVVGRAAVRDYWRRQFAAISSNVEPEGFTEEPDGSITVDVHQVVHDAPSGELVSDSRVRHRYQLEDGLIVRMDVSGTAWLAIRGLSAPTLLIARSDRDGAYAPLSRGDDPTRHRRQADDLHAVLLSAPRAHAGGSRRAPGPASAAATTSA
jgi:ketosteroid isomerase-like protein